MRAWGATTAVLVLACSGKLTSVGGGSGGEETDGQAGGSSNDGGGAHCGQIPTLHQRPPSDVYCGLGGDGGALECLNGSGYGICCLGRSLGGGAYAPNACSSTLDCTNSAPDAGGNLGIPVECAQLNDCSNNGQGEKACCLQGASPPVEVPGCGYPATTGGSAVLCELSAGCAPGEVQICSSNADCPSGNTCTPGLVNLFEVGFCM